MGWITKNSATQQIDRRDEPYLDPQMRDQLEREILPRYPERKAATLPVLHALQEKHGWLPYQSIEEAADFLGVQASEVLDTATFYEEFWLRPRGRYVIWVCQSISCEIMGEPNLTQRLVEHLGVDPGETTDDGKFTLMKVECLGACGSAPCALVNEELHERLTPDNFVRILSELE
jgi:NADH-quinone oxidoreductase subunit E